MKIGGLLKFSTIDYPNHLSCVIFTQGCNWRCPFCHNPDLIAQKKASIIDEKKIHEFLASRVGFIEAIVISGGEPTVQKKLIPFIESLKKFNFKIKLDTNGSRADVVKQIVEKKLIDYFAIDIKSSEKKYKASTGGSKYPKELKSTIDLIESSNIDFELRTTVVPNLVDKIDIEEIGKLYGGRRKYILQEFRDLITLSNEYNDKSELVNIVKYKEVAEKYFYNVELRGFYESQKEIRKYS